MSNDLITTVLFAAGSALATCVGVLFRMVVRLFNQQVDMSEKIGKLQGRQDGIEELSARVLDVVHKSTKKNPKDDD